MNVSGISYVLSKNYVELGFIKQSYICYKRQYCVNGRAETSMPSNTNITITHTDTA